MSDEFVILSSSRENVPVSPAQTKSFADRRLRFSEAQAATGSFGEMLFQKVALKRSTLWYCTYQIKRAVKLYGAVGHPIMEGHITLKNRCVQSLGRGDECILDAGQFNLTAAPYMENKAYFPDGGEYVTFDIHPNRELLIDLSQDFDFLADFLDRVEKGSAQAVSLYKTNLFLSPDMNYLVIKILNELSHKDAYKSYVEVLLIELPLMMLMRGSDPAVLQKSLKQQDVEALRHAREVMIKEAEKTDWDYPYDTLAQMAERTGLSLYKFKTGFKSLFGISPYKFLLSLRLHLARKLLRETRSSILDIAIKVGYSSREGFSNAYKSMFKISPSEDR